MDAAKNFAKVQVSTGYDAAATSIVLVTGHGAKLPTAPFNVTWWNATDYPDPADDPNVEIVRVTAISTDTLTVIRAQENTSASTKNEVGKTYLMVAGPTAKLIEDISKGVHIHTATEKTTPVDGDFVGLVDSAASNVLKKLSWANIKATLKAYFDTLYQPVGGGGGGWDVLGQARLASAATTILDLDSISTDYDLFRITVFWKSAVNSSKLMLRFNNDSTAGNYGYQEINGNGANATASEDDSDDAIRFVSGFSANNNAYMMSEIIVSKPTAGFEAAVLAKTLINETFGNCLAFVTTAAWLNTASKITRITLLASQANAFRIGSVALIEGKKLS